MTIDTTTTATIWLGDSEDPMNGPVVLENEETAIAVERTDVNEIAIHATMPGDKNALVSLYFTRDKAAIVAADLIRAWQ